MTKHQSHPKFFQLDILVKRQSSAARVPSSDETVPIAVKVAK